MLVKWIDCDVSADNRTAFSRAQERWTGLATSRGFLTQAGGWDLGSRHAIVVSIWKEAEAYQAFMQHQHDDFVAANRQQDTYRSCRTSLFEELLEMHGSSDRQFSECLDQGAVLRAADCELHPGRAGHFEQAQASWATAMREAGMLAGLFCKLSGSSEPDRYLVLSLWRSLTEHERYQQECVPRLRANTSVETDVASLRGSIVPLEPTWLVLADGSTDD